MRKLSVGPSRTLRRDCWVGLRRGPYLSGRGLTAHGLCSVNSLIILWGNGRVILCKWVVKTLNWIRDNTKKTLLPSVIRRFDGRKAFFCGKTYARVHAYFLTVYNSVVTSSVLAVSTRVLTSCPHLTFYVVAFRLEIGVVSSGVTVGEGGGVDRFG